MAISPIGRIRVNVTGARGAIGLDFIGEPTPGQFVTFSPLGPRKVTSASGTGADAGLRTDLASTLLASTIIAGLPYINAEALGVTPNVSADQGQACRDANAIGVATGKMVQYPSGIISIGTSIVIIDKLQMRGAAQYGTTFQQKSGSVQPTFTLGSGPIICTNIGDFRCAGNNVADEHCFYMHARPASGSTGGNWYGVYRRIIVEHYGGKSWWWRGGTDTGGQDCPHQFLTFSDISVNRGARETSRSWSETGKCGQFDYVNVQADAEVSGGSQTPGLNFCSSREFYNSATGKYGDIFDACSDPINITMDPAWSAVSATAGYVHKGDITCQGSYHGAWIDVSTFSTKWDFEANYRSILALNTAVVDVIDCEGRNAGQLNNPSAGTPESDDGNGFFAGVAGGTIYTGWNKLGGGVGKVYKRIGSGNIVPIATDYIATSDDADDINVSDHSVQIGVNDFILNAGAGVDFFIVPTGVVDLHTINSFHSVGTEVTLKIVGDGGVVRVMAGGNIGSPEITKNRRVVLRNGDLIKFQRSSFPSAWNISGGHIAELVSMGNPTGFHEQYEYIRNIAATSGQPSGYTCSATGTPGNFVNGPPFA